MKNTKEEHLTMEALEWAGKSPFICLSNWSKKALRDITKDYIKAKGEPLTLEELRRAYKTGKYLKLKQG